MLSSQYTKYSMAFHISLYIHTYIHTVICNNGDTRLVNGPTEMEGRVELCWREAWGTVCDRDWGLNDGKVVCRQLGFSSLCK